MGLIWADLTDDLSPEEYASRKEWLDRCSSNDLWANKIFKKREKQIRPASLQRDDFSNLSLLLTVTESSFQDEQSIAGYRSHHAATGFNPQTWPSYLVAIAATFRHEFIVPVKMAFFDTDKVTQ